MSPEDIASFTALNSFVVFYKSKIRAEEKSILLKSTVKYVSSISFVIYQVTDQGLGIT
jgi:hypothetical protein